MHDQYGIGVVRQGAQKSRSGRGMVEAGAGDTITCNPSEIHDGLPIGDSGRAWTMLYFEPWLIADIAADIREGKGGSWEFELPRLRSRRIAGRFDGLFAALTRDGGEARGAEELLLCLVAELMRHGRDIAFSTAPDAVAAARARIDDDPAAPVTLTDLASEAGLSRFQLVRGFARTFGLTPHAYLMQRRIHRARRLIAWGDSLAAAAAAAGFSDQSHMTRLFVRYYGFPPGAYARAVG
jgi:AraC-like DNA-binding protein